jgi:predicted GNAT family acetyltransferase
VNVVVRDNAAERRFETTVEGHTAYIDYRLADGAIVFQHTEVPAPLEGRGVGAALVRGALEAAQAKGLAVVPVCPFVSAYIRRHPEYAPLVRARA